MKFFTQVIPTLRKYRPIAAATVAEAMIKAANQQSQSKIKIYELDQIF